MSFAVGGDLEAGRQGEIKYEVRSTKYEVEELGATELRRGVEGKRGENGARGVNPCSREVEVPLVRRASVTRMGISMAAVCENFIGTSVTEITSVPRK